METSTESKQLLDRESFRDLLQSLSINLEQQEVAVSVLGRLGVVVADVHRRDLRQIHTMPYSAAVRRTRRDSEAVREDALNFIQRRAVPSPERRDVRGKGIADELDITGLKRVFNDCDPRDDEVLLR